MSLRHRDAFGRVKYVDQTKAGYEHYLRPHDGRLVPLRVQGTDNAYGYGQRTWERNGRPRSRVSAILHLAHWTYSSVLVEGTEERRYNSATVPALAFRWIPSCLILAVLLLIPQNLEGVFKNGGFYDPVQYQDWRYPKVSRNRREGELGSPPDKDAEEKEPLLEGDIEMRPQLPPRPVLPMVDEKIDEEFDDLPARHYRPRYLCFLQDGPRGPDTEYARYKVTDWIQEHGDFASTDFVLISYTRHHFLVSADQKWRNKPEPDAETKAQYEQQAHEDRGMVLAYGMEAARTAGKRAFWVDFECIRDKDTPDDVVRGHVKNEDVYRISDIVRAAHSLVILVGPPHDSRPPGQPQQDSYSPAAMTEWLQHWGSRLWTLPEILLCSPERRIKIYAVGGPNPPEEIAKRNVAARCVWSDAKWVRNLVDHYESSIHLTPLELVSIALECFSSRETDQFSGGDIAYALMGLLRRRPAVVTKDTSFEAFARLSLANDSDKLLERLICMQPTRRDAPWHKIRDAWNVKLWDIEPRCQVAGIVDDQTVTLDGAFGATIQWDAMEQVAFLKRPTVSRLVGKILLRGVPAYLIIGLAFTIIGGVFLAETNSNSDSDSSSNSPSLASSGAAAAFLAPGLIFLIPSAIITLLIPVMLLNIYQGKFWSVQAHFLGLQGIPKDIGDIERILFGFNHGRLKWSVAGSPLSRNGPSKNGERVGHPPAKSAHPQDRSYDNGHQPEAAEKETVFTLIDTYAMTATAFRAARPPTAVIVCGHEGGMQRAILCSYDWQEGTFVREAVIRVKTLVLDRMFRVDRFRFALNRKAHRPAKHVGSSADAARHDQLHERNRFWDRWKIDICLLPFMFLVHGVYTVDTANGSHPMVGPELYHVAFLLLQPLNYVLFRKVNMGNVVGFAALVKGIIAIVSNFVSSNSAGLALDFIFGLADGILVPAFVYLTGLWYDGAWGRMLRIVIWASGQTFFPYLPDFSNGGVFPLALSWAIISILLAGYAFSFLGTPEQALWLWESQRSLSSSARPWHQQGSSFKILALFKDVQTYFFIATFLSVAAFSSCNLNYIDYQLLELPRVTLVFLFPLILVLFLGVLFTKYRYAQLPTTIIVVTLSFAGKIQLAQMRESVPYGAGADGLYFLQRISNFAIFLTWALLLTDMVETQAFLGTLCIAFVAYGLGNIIVGAFLASATSRQIRSRRPHVPGFNVVLVVFFALAVISLVSWSVYRFWTGRNGRGSAVSPAGVYHQQVDEQPFDHDADNGYRSPLATASKQSRVDIESHNSPDRTYTRGRGSV
ncbi:hypothetical protein GGR57DRAFT_481567 [Xylariaceae sp. FL1272]|nr:hypothetical protein GGR57DRAFT_481567 [Xylariaceae sp. FL1272]